METMKKYLKKLLGLGLAVSLAAGCNGMTALADSSISESFNGTTVTATVWTNSDSANATTTYYQPSSIEAIATVYYYHNGNQYSRQGPVATNTMGGATSTARVGHSGGQVVGGKGNHYVSYGNARWSYTTTTGATW